MPFYLRKSISIGPFRLNLSKSGLGVSAGVKGLRIGTGPRGHYIHAGMNGVYYRKTLGGVGERPKAVAPPAEKHCADVSEAAIRDKLPTYITEDGILMRRVMSAETKFLVSESHAEALASLNEARGRASMAALLTITAGFLLGITLLAAQPVAIAATGLLFALAWFCGSQIDASRRHVVFAYDLAPGAETRYRNLVEALDTLGTSRLLQYVKAQGDITNLHAWKKNAGATRACCRMGSKPVDVRLPPRCGADSLG
ncbi:hypothetical protein GCM10011505_50870 [Tistrella bauzanensis]|uniref:DUF4236 domain-containing protein n=1 Tax=Tistrella bauzanensis TaxID=657419 RepID=A0ABQ1JAP2_9PROT|nr:DUF4236 domain-containing protein [Tistrella bauzanensis]GGB64220.1 hypothetical protein GCM10011505_50870 [Tistrella bauzanensis]